MLETMYDVKSTSFYDRIGQLCPICHQGYLLKDVKRLCADVQIITDDPHRWKCNNFKCAHIFI
jgi:hypothetical protein